MNTACLGGGGEWGGGEGFSGGGGGGAGSTMLMLKCCALDGSPAACNVGLDVVQVTEKDTNKFVQATDLMRNVELLFGCRIHCWNRSPATGFESAASPEHELGAVTTLGQSLRAAHCRETRSVNEGSAGSDENV